MRPNTLSKKFLSDIIKSMRSYPELKIMIEGNAGTDYAGQHKYYGRGQKVYSQWGELNGEWSTVGQIMKARARAIYDFLINEGGINPSRIKYGPGELYKTPAGRTVKFNIINE